jgi:hypothetical protein
MRCLLDELPSGALAVTPRIISGADEFLPYWDERPFAIAGNCDGRCQGSHEIGQSLLSRFCLVIYTNFKNRFRARLQMI